MAELRSSCSRGANAANLLFNQYLHGTLRNRVPHVAASLSASTCVADVEHRRVDEAAEVTAEVSSPGCYTSRGCKHGHFLSPRSAEARALLFIRAYSGNGTREAPLYRSKTAYYEILEVPPTSTQAQIKTAYYKQSFIYHPDRNAGSDEATARFSEISEAYTVLGNKGLRKKYDRGLLSQMDLTSAARPQTKDSSSGPTKSQSGGRHSVMGTGNPSDMFNFDKFYKSHYGEQLQREQDLRFRREQLLKKKQESVGEKKADDIVEAAALFALIVASILLMGFR
ncbi:dnaJ homolog subfamily C member 30, mitochondrial-like [Synchiropus picturatus]